MYSLNKKEQYLLARLQELVSIERMALSEILQHLQVIQDTRLYAKIGFCSLKKYMIKKLKYSSSAADRRVKALKLTQQVPEAKVLIEKGELNLSLVDKLQTVLKGESSEIKKSAMAQIKNQTVDQAIGTLFEMFPDKVRIPKNSRRRVSSGQVMFSITVDNATADKIEQLQAWTKKYDLSELLTSIVAIAHNSTNPLNVKARSSRGSKNPRTIPAAVKREIYQRAKGKCEYLGCNSIHNLEYDHRKPVSQGGSNEKTNLRLLCKSHNQLLGMQILGRRVMQKYLN